MRKTENHKSFGLKQELLKLRVYTIKALLVLFAAILFQGCFVFKKKCDCPTFGKTPAKSAMVQPS